jgi:hypothetical protein
MFAFRRIGLATVAAASLLLGLTASDAHAQQYRYGYGHVGNVQTRYYYLYYRGSTHQPWSYCGATASYRNAVAYAGWVRSLGYEVFLR